MVERATPIPPPRSEQIMSSIVETASQMPTSRAARRVPFHLWLLAIALVAIVGCALLASAHPDPTAFDAASIVGP